MNHLINELINFLLYLLVMITSRPQDNSKIISFFMFAVVKIDTLQSPVSCIALASSTLILVSFGYFGFSLVHCRFGNDSHCESADSIKNSVKKNHSPDQGCLRYRSFLPFLRISLGVLSVVFLLPLAFGETSLK